MKINLKNQTVKKAGLTIIYYLIAFALVYLSEETSPSGPCANGFGLLFIYLLPLVATILFIINFIKVYRGNNTHKGSAIIHFIVLSIFVIYLGFIVG